MALVIGGHSGFGEAITERFVAEGAQVVIAARRVEVLEQAAARLGAGWVRCDITDDDDVARLVAEVLDRHGRLDIGVNCAGFEQATPLAELTPDRLAAMHAVQLTGALYVMRHVGNALADAGGGAFVSLSSLTAHNPAVGLTAYASAKAAVEYATKIAALEYGPLGVRFNCIAASLIETPMTQRIFRAEPVIQAQIEMTPLGRMGTCADVANAVHFLCSDDGAFITGQTLLVDGGASLLALPTPQMYADVARRWQERRASAASD